MPAMVMPLIGQKHSTLALFITILKWMWRISLLSSVNLSGGVSVELDSFVVLHGNSDNLAAYT